MNPWPASRTVPDMLSRLYREGRIVGYQIGEFRGGYPTVTLHFTGEKGTEVCSREGMTIEEAFALAVIGLPEPRRDLSLRRCSCGYETLWKQCPACRVKGKRVRTVAPGDPR